jgi:2-amino-4-hydroxy-6-hydroxymethyldihydropteridine diphosphokinase
MWRSKPANPVSDVFVGLGGNLGDREALLAEALRKLDATSGITVERISSLYETKPVGQIPQPDFLNLVAKLTTNLPPYALLNTCLRIETELGRERRERWGPRTVDLDVLWCEGVAQADEKLTLPHPRMHERGFVLVPLAELAPKLKLGGREVAELVEALGEQKAAVQKKGALFWRESEKR